MKSVSSSAFENNTEDKAILDFEELVATEQVSSQDAGDCKSQDSMSRERKSLAQQKFIF